ncbi:hypothetical protein AB0J72_49890 [Dactylosporangium sp. NPDC049742]|uniref:tetratricopeptide repeat protein n=1 Tax=Dactylosporangium sp. NPDC049742 TaxID=3154737 RepID=UPI00342B6C9C
MDAEDLDYRTRTQSGCIPPDVVTRLIELGHTGEVELQAGRGEWFCALELARRRPEQAAALLAPFVATGWWTAVQSMAELLEGQGRIGEAIDLVRPLVAAGNEHALRFHGGLLTRHGRAGEAFALLAPHVADWYLAGVLVEAAAAAGRDEEAAALLTARIEAGAGRPQHRMEPFTAFNLLARIRERQGRVDDAVAVLRTREVTSMNNRDALAELLARHDRVEELRAYAATEYHGNAARRLAELLEERGDVEGAIAVYRNPGDSETRRFHGASSLAELLVRHGRSDEATEVLREFASTSRDDWIVDTLCTHYAAQGRAGDGLAFLDALGLDDWDFFRIRLELMAGCGRLDEALELARAHPEGDTRYAAGTVAGLLAGAGRTEEAVDVLERDDSGWGSHALAGYLLDLGRVKDAVVVLQRPVPRPTWPVPVGQVDEPPF